MIASGCYFVNKEELAKLTAHAMVSDKCAVNLLSSAPKIAEACGFEVPESTKILVAELEESDLPTRCLPRSLARCWPAIK